MMNDNHYRIYFHDPTDDATASVMHRYKSSYVQHGREHGARDGPEHVYLEEPKRGTATGMAGWVITPESVQPHHLTTASDREVTSNHAASYDCSPRDELPVFDIDDGGYTNVDLGDDTSATCRISSSSSDPHVIVIKCGSTTGDHEEDKRPSCLSRLCFQFWA